MEVFTKYSRGTVKTEIYSTLGASLKALLSRLLKEEVFSAEEIPPGRQKASTKTRRRNTEGSVVTYESLK